MADSKTVRACMIMLVAGVLAGLVGGLVACSAAAAASDAPAQGRWLGPRSGEGAHLAVRREANAVTTAIHVAWRGGQRAEDAQSAGVHRLLAATLLPEPALAQLAALGASVVVASGRDSFSVRIEVPSARAAAALGILVVALQQPAFAADLVAEGRDRVARERAQRDDDGGALAMRAAMQALWLVHPYRLDPLGSDATLARQDSQALAALWRTRYGLARATIVVVGALGEDAVAAALLAHGAGSVAASSTASPPARETVAPRTPPRERYVTTSHAEAHLVFAFAGAAFADGDRAAFELLGAVLGGRDGALATLLGTRLALAYRVDADAVAGEDPGYLALHVACAPEEVAEVRALVGDELARLAKDGPTVDELTHARAWLAAEVARQARGRAGRAARLANALMFGDADAAAGAVPDHRAVRAVARRLLDPARGVTVVAGPLVATPAAATRLHGKRSTAPQPKRRAPPRPAAPGVARGPHRP